MADDSIARIGLIGLRDKLYWRPWGPRPLGAEIFHCFKAVEGGGYVSLCGEHVRRRSGGQQTARPPVSRRCGRCDQEEIKRRGVDASILPTNNDWRDFLAKTEHT